MKLHDAVFRRIRFEHLADAEFSDTPLARRVIVALQDYHVTSVATTPFQVAASGCAFLNRRDHFEELAANREQRVLESERLHSGIAMADLESKHSAQVIDYRCELVRDKCYLA
jgi:hypothetical protein